MNKRGKGTLAVVQTLSEVHPELRRQISSSRCGFLSDVEELVPVLQPLTHHRQ